MWVEFSLPGAAGMVIKRMRWIPPGTFQMGSPKGEPGRDDDEGPQHKVSIRAGYWLFDTPVTQRLWLVVMAGENPSRFQSPERPVEQVSWEECQQFLEKINGMVPGLQLSLPSEAQWEYACRAGSETALYTGPIEIIGSNNAPALDEIAWYGGNTGKNFELENGYDSSDWKKTQYPHKKAGTHPVKKKRANRWGLYDMLGNVWEWCLDGRRKYTAEDVTDPLGSQEPSGNRVFRGGSWGNFARYCRCARRNADPSGYRNDNVGFRCARVQGTGPEQGVLAAGARRSAEPRRSGSAD